MSHRKNFGRVLAIDYGTRNIGLAVSDELRLTVRPLKTFKRRSWKHTIRQLTEIVAALDVHLIVFGLPLSLSGEKNTASKQMLAVAEKLGLTLAIPVVTYNEALTTFAAKANHPLADVKQSGIDALAANEILSDYLMLK